MVILKKLFFSFPFLLTFALFVSQLNPFLQNTNLIFSLSWEIFLQLFLLTVFLALAAIFFAAFITLAADWRYTVPVFLLASLSPLLFIKPPEAFILMSGFFFSFAITFLFLEKELAGYLTFHASKILNPSIHQVILLCTLTISTSFYFKANTEIAMNGFKLPDSLVDTAIQMSGGNQLSGQVEKSLEQNGLPSNITPEMIATAKQNPALLQQYGIDPKMLDSLVAPTKTVQESATASIVKPLVEQKVQEIIQPLKPYLPLILALLFFFTLTTLTSLLTLPAKFLVWLLFYILEKSGFVTFTTETREVKKLVV